MGIVSTLARDEHVTLSNCVDYVFYIQDNTWGGQAPGANHLAPTSAQLVEASAAFVAIGGGDLTLDQTLARWAEAGDVHSSRHESRDCSREGTKERRARTNLFPRLRACCACYGHRTLRSSRPKSSEIGPPTRLFQATEVIH